MFYWIEKQVSKNECPKPLLTPPWEIQCLGCGRKLTVAFKQTRGDLSTFQSLALL